MRGGQLNNADICDSEKDKWTTYHAVNAIQGLASKINQNLTFLLIIFSVKPKGIIQSLLSRQAHCQNLTVLKRRLCIFLSPW